MFDDGRTDALDLDAEGPAGRGSLDRVDLAVLRALLGDARASQRRVAREVGMSAAAVGERIARLERTGIIAGYRTAIDRLRLGFGLTAYVSVVAVDALKDPDKTLDWFRSFPEVEEAAIVTGPMDVMLRLRARDHHHLRDTLMRIWRLPGVSRTQTFLTLKEAQPKEIDIGLLEILYTELSHGKPPA